MKKQHSGFFLTIEGGEGTGKSTLVERLHAYLTEGGLSVVKTREPGGTAFGVKVRELLLQENGVAISPRAELFLFLADRAHHVETLIKPALAQDKIVICDRFNDSSIAYQGGARRLEATDGHQSTSRDGSMLPGGGAARKISTDQLEEVCLFATDQLVPDLTFYLDLDPEVALTRIKRGMDRMEKERLDFHKRVRAGYLALTRENPKRIHLIDASQTPTQVFEQALSCLSCHPVFFKRKEQDLQDRLRRQDV